MDARSKFSSQRSNINHIANMKRIKDACDAIGKPELHVREVSHCGIKQQ